MAKGYPPVCFSLRILLGRIKFLHTFQRDPIRASSMLNSHNKETVDEPLRREGSLRHQRWAKWLSRDEDCQVSPSFFSVWYGYTACGCFGEFMASTKDTKGLEKRICLHFIPTAKTMQGISLYGGKASHSRNDLSCCGGCSLVEKTPTRSHPTHTT